LPSTHVSSVTQDTEGTLWFAFRQTGVASLRDGRLLNHGIVNGLPNAGIRHMVSASDGTLWAAAKRGGVFAYDADQWAPDTRVVAAPKEIYPGSAGVFSFSRYDSWNDTAVDKLLYSWRVVPAGHGRSLAPWSAFSSLSTIGGG
jgi:hypothetical protein